VYFGLDVERFLYELAVVVHFEDEDDGSQMHVEIEDADDGFQITLVHQANWECVGFLLE